MSQRGPRKQEKVIMAKQGCQGVLNKYNVSSRSFLQVELEGKASARNRLRDEQLLLNRQLVE